MNIDINDPKQLFRFTVERLLTQVVESEGLAFLDCHFEPKKMRRLNRQLRDGRMTASGLATSMGGHKNAVKLLPNDVILPPCVRYLIDFDLLS